MATYNGRRGPNVSEYIANLNTVPPFELPGQVPDASLDFDDDLALFTNTEFFDFDMGELPNMPQSFEYDQVQERRVRRENATHFRQGSSANKQQQQQQQPTSAVVSASLGVDFPQFPDFSTFSPVEPASATAASFSPVEQSTPIYPHAGYSGGASSPVSPSNAPQHATKRKLDALVDPASQHQAIVDETARVAAEEDKRRRNTAASARFRIKKKQREQALEKTAKEMTDKVSLLESRVSQLEMENKWLKSLITEKNSLKGDFAEMYKKLNKDGPVSDTPRSSSERTDGVGTKEEKA